MRYWNLLVVGLAIGSLALWTSPAAAQEEMDAEMAAWQKAGQPGAHHDHLATFAGTWQAESKFWMEPSADPTVSPATIEYKMIMGGRYLEETISSDFMGQPFTGRGLYGFNNVTGEVQAVWIDDTSTGIFLYSGSISDDGTEIRLNGKYKDPVTGDWRENRSVMRISKDNIHYVSYEMDGGDEWKMMEITGTRKM
jgi:hypothetical protein